MGQICSFYTLNLNAKAVYVREKYPKLNLQFFSKIPMLVGALV
jgi:hypothetical protein